MRMNNQTGALEAGLVYLPEQAHWLDEYLHELTAFPNGKHFDQVDSTSQALAWITKTNSASGWISYLSSKVHEENKKRGFTVQVRAPQGVLQLWTHTGRQPFMYRDRTAWVSEAEAAYLVTTGWERV